MSLSVPVAPSETVQKRQVVDVPEGRKHLPKADLGVISQPFVTVLKYLTQAAYKEEEVYVAHCFGGSKHCVCISPILGRGSPSRLCHITVAGNSRNNCGSKRSRLALGGRASLGGAWFRLL